MHTPSGEDRRGLLIIDPRLPRRVLKVFAFHLLGVGLCIGLPLFAMMRAVDVMVDDRSQRVIALFDRWQTYLFIALGVYVLVATAGWLMASLWRTHRTAGPIVRLTRFVHDLSAGKFTARIMLRERDELQALADGLNGLAESLEARDKALLQEISDRVDSLNSPDDSPPTAADDAPKDVVELVDSAFEGAHPTRRPAFTPNPN